MKPAKAATPHLETKRLVLWMPDPSEAALVLDYFERNRAHLGPWSPRRPPDHSSVEHWEERLASDLRDFEEGRSLRLFLRLRDDASRRVIGSCGLSHIVRGAFHACFLGYSIDADREGTGLMSEAVGAVVAHGFRELGLHRIQANCVPENERSRRLLERLGFVTEGLARDYLQIDGAWRDHVLTSITTPDWQAGDSGEP